jgi:hypothetical protein
MALQLRNYNRLQLHVLISAFTQIGLLVPVILMSAAVFRWPTRKLSDVRIYLITFYYISKKMQRCTAYLYLETALHVSGGTSTYHEELIQLYPQHLVFVTLLLLSAAIVEKVELQLEFFHDSGR